MTGPWSILNLAFACIFTTHTRCSFFFSSFYHTPTPLLPTTTNYYYYYTQQERREREQQDLELAKEMNDEDEEDGFP